MWAWFEQDAEVGDGTTSVVLLAGEILKHMKPFIEEGLHSQIIIRSVRKAAHLAVQHINDIAVKVANALKERILPNYTLLTVFHLL